jgi:hypothetical protein
MSKTEREIMQEKPNISKKTERLVSINVLKLKALRARNRQPVYNTKRIAYERMKKDQEISSIKDRINTMK